MEREWRPEQYETQTYESLREDKGTPIEVAPSHEVEVDYSTPYVEPAPAVEEDSNNKPLTRNTLAAEAEKISHVAPKTPTTFRGVATQALDFFKAKLDKGNPTLLPFDKSSAFRGTQVDKLPEEGPHRTRAYRTMGNLAPLLRDIKDAQNSGVDSTETLAEHIVNAVRGTGTPGVATRTTGALLAEKAGSVLQATANFISPPIEPHVVKSGSYEGKKIIERDELLGPRLASAIDLVTGRKPVVLRYDIAGGIPMRTQVELEDMTKQAAALRYQTGQITRRTFLTGVAATAVDALLRSKPLTGIYNALTENAPETTVAAPEVAPPVEPPVQPVVEAELEPVQCNEGGYAKVPGMLGEQTIIEDATPLKAGDQVIIDGKEHMVVRDGLYFCNGEELTQVDPNNRPYYLPAGKEGTIFKKKP